MSSLEDLRAHPRIAHLSRGLASHTPLEVEDSTARRAGVTILIRLGATGDPEIFFIQRSEYAGDPWSGQIAFPGGREEPGDESLLATAMRETQEETQIDIRRHGELLGILDDLRPRTIQLPPVVVRPFVVLMGETPEPVLSHEVASSFWVPLSVLFDRSVWRDTTVVAGGIEMSRFAFHHQGFVVWGMTERILSGLLELLQ